MAMNGTDFLLYVNTGTPTVPAYELVGSQRDAAVDENTAEIDVSSKDLRAGRVLGGRYSSKISLDQLYVPTDNAYVALKAAMRSGDLILVLRQENGVDVETANCLVTALGEKFPDQDAATVSISMTVDGEWTAFSS